LEARIEAKESTNNILKNLEEKENHCIALSVFAPF